MLPVLERTEGGYRRESRCSDAPVVPIRAARSLPGDRKTPRQGPPRMSCHPGRRLAPDAVGIPSRSRPRGPRILGTNEVPPVKQAAGGTSSKGRRQVPPRHWGRRGGTRADGRSEASHCPCPSAFPIASDRGCAQQPRVIKPFGSSGYRNRQPRSLVNTRHDTDYRGSLCARALGRGLSASSRVQSLLGRRTAG